MQYDGQWLRDRRHGTGTLTIESAGKAGSSHPDSRSIPEPRQSVLQLFSRPWTTGFVYLRWTVGGRVFSATDGFLSITAVVLGYSASVPVQSTDAADTIGHDIQLQFGAPPETFDKAARSQEETGEQETKSHRMQTKEMMRHLAALHFCPLKVRGGF